MFTSRIGANKKTSQISPTTRFPIHKLANEIVIKIIEKMDPKDREHLAQLDDRMCGLEKMAGHRRFECVKFAAHNGDICMSSQTTIYGFIISTPSDEISSFIKDAKTRMLGIFGRWDIYAERALHKATKTLKFKVLVIEINDEVSYRQVILILCQFIRQCRCIEEIRIKWHIESVEESKKLLMNLPSMVKLSKISLCCNGRFVDDELFLNLLHKSSCDIIINCDRNSISTAGIAKAFQMVFSGKRKGKITCNPHPNEWKNYCREMVNSNDFEYVISNVRTFKHIESGATFTVDFDLWRPIEMASAQLTP